MANVESMQMLRDLAKRKSDKAVEDLGRLRRQHQDAEERLRQLEQYRDEYRQKLQDALSTGVSSSQWRDFQQFLASLDRAIEQQQSQIGEQRSRVDGGMSRWQSETRKLNAFETLHARGMHERSSRQAKDEQRQSDEMAAQLRRRQQHETDREH